MRGKLSSFSDMLERRARQSLRWKAQDKRPQFPASGEAVGASRTSIGECRGSFMLLEKYEGDEPSARFLNMKKDSRRVK